jgi:hypothetical protein
MWKLRKFFRPIQLIGLGLLGILGMTGCASTPKPLDTPFTLHQGTEVAEFEVRIPERYTYVFGFSFFYKDPKQYPADSWRILKLVGTGTQDKDNKYVNLGEPLKVRLQIYSVGKKTPPFAFDEIKTEIVNYAVGSGYFSKRIANVLLEPGVYKVRLENLLTAPAMQGTPIHFHIGKAYFGK